MTSLHPDNLEYIILGSDSHYYHKSWNAPVGQSSDGKDHWKPSRSQWIDIGGQFSSEPVICRWGADFFVFGINTASNLVYKRYNGTTRAWYGEQWIPLNARNHDSGKWVTKPGTVVSYPDWLELFIVDEEGMLRFFPVIGRLQEFLDLSWWFSRTIPGPFKEPPAVTKSGPKRFDVFCTSAEGKLYHKWWIDSPQASLTAERWYPQTLNGFENLGQFHSQAQAISKSPGTIDLMIIGYDGKLRHRVYDDSWKDWETMDGLYKGVPELVSFDPERLDAFVIDQFDNVIHKVHTCGGGWGLSEVVAGPTISNRVTATSWGPGRIDLTFVKEDSKVWHKSYQRDFGWLESPLGFTPSDPTTYDIGGSVRSRVGSQS